MPRQASVDPSVGISRVLVVGLGSIGARHLRLGRTLLPEATFAVLRSGTSPATANEPADADVRVLHSIDDAITFAPTVAVIASPSPFHAEAAARLAATGVHLLIEKPLADTLAAALRIRDVVAQAGVTVAVGYNLRFSPGLLAMRAALESQRIGRVLSVRAEVGQYLPDWRPGRDYRDSVSAQQSLGGGVLLELSHEIDYLGWMFGVVSTVQATLVRTGALEVDVEDCAHLVLGFTEPGGRALHATLTMDFVRRDARRMCTVIGERGTLEWNAMLGTVRLFDGDAQGWQTLFDAPIERDATYSAEWNDLAKCITSGATPRTSLEDGVRVLRVVEAAREAARTGCVVTVRSGDDTCRGGG
ncbi:MAG: Gfo/Idh/MocA family oxidoreductase [Gemmatimonadota bacterium]